MTKLAEISTLLSLLISILGLAVATYYAVKTYNLSVDVSNNKEQINRLDTLVVRNDSSISNLITVVNELKTQNTRLSDVNDKLIMSLDKSKKQSKLLGSELNISTEELSKINQQTLGIVNQNNVHLFYSVLSLSNLWHKNIGLPYKDSLSKKLSFIIKVDSVLKSELNNRYLLSLDTLNSKWQYNILLSSETINELSNLSNSDVKIQVNLHWLTGDSLAIFRRKKSSKIFQDYFESIYQLFNYTNLHVKRQLDAKYIFTLPIP